MSKPRSYGKAERVVRVAVIALGSFLAVLLMIGGILAIRDDTRPSPSQSQRPIADPPQRDKESFRIVVERVRDSLGSMGRQRLNPIFQNDLNPRDGLDVTIDSELVLNPTELFTNNLEIPSKGTIRFGVKIEGTMRGEQRTEKLGSLQFAIPFTTKEQVEAVYLHRDGRWSLSEVTLTTTDYQVHVPGEAEANLVSRLMAADLQRTRSQLVGRVMRIPASTDITFIRLLREATTAR